MRLTLLLLFAFGAACSEKKVAAVDAGPVTPRPPPFGSMLVLSDQPFPGGELARGGSGCRSADDCVVVSLFGNCWPVRRELLAGDFAKRYAQWIADGNGQASGAPPTLTRLESAEVLAICGDWAGVACTQSLCVLTPEDCEIDGTRAADCLARGGQWGGCRDGRGRTPGCNPPTTDGDRPCTDSSQCQGACVKGLCTRFKRYKGCGVMVGGRVLCKD